MSHSTRVLQAKPARRDCTYLRTPRPASMKSGREGSEADEDGAGRPPAWASSDGCAANKEPRTGLVAAGKGHSSHRGRQGSDARGARTRRLARVRVKGRLHALRVGPHTLPYQSCSSLVVVVLVSRRGALHRAAAPAATRRVTGRSPWLRLPVRGLAGINPVAVDVDGVAQ